MAQHLSPTIAIETPYSGVAIIRLTLVPEEAHVEKTWEQSARERRLAGPTAWSRGSQTSPTQMNQRPGDPHRQE